MITLTLTKEPDPTTLMVLRVIFLGNLLALPDGTRFIQPERRASQRAPRLRTGFVETRYHSGQWQGGSACGSGAITILPAKLFSALLQQLRYLDMDHCRAQKGEWESMKVITESNKTRPRSEKKYQEVATKHPDIKSKDTNRWSNLSKTNTKARRSMRMLIQSLYL